MIFSPMGFDGIAESFRFYLNTHGLALGGCQKKVFLGLSYF